MDYNKNKDGSGFVPDCYEDIESLSHRNRNCVMPVRRHLQPILVAKIYNQPIIEQMPCSDMTMTLENCTTISSLCSDMKPICGDCDDDCWQ